MGLKNWIIKKLTGFDAEMLKNPNKANSGITSEMADAMLKNALAQSIENNKVAQKLYRVKMLEMQNRQQLEALQNLDDNGGEEFEEEDEEEPDNLEQMLMKGVVEPVLRAKLGAMAPQTAAEPSAQSSPEGQESPLRKKARGKFDNLTEEQLKKLDAMGILDV